MKITYQPAGEPAGLIHKYYPSLGQHLTSPTLPELVGEWFSDLCRLGIASIDYYVSDRYERASNKAEFLACVAMLLGEAEQHAHLPGYGYLRHYPVNYLTPAQESEIQASGLAALRAVREWHTLASLSPIEQFLDRARKIELWQNERHQLVTRETSYDEWAEEYGVMLLALQRAIPTAKKKLLRAAYTELKQLIPTLAAGRPLKWQRLYDEGQPFFSSSLTATYAYSEFVPLRPTRNTTDQISEYFFQHLHFHLSCKEWHVWQALILLAGALGEAAPPTPETFLENQPEPAGPQSFDNLPTHQPLIVLKSQYEEMREILNKTLADVEAKANTQGYTLFDKPVSAARPAKIDTESPPEREAQNNPYGMPNAIWELYQQMQKDGLLRDQREAARLQLEMARQLAASAPVPITTQHSDVRARLDGPHPRTGTTIADLCLPPYTPDDLTALLQYLGLLNSQGDNLTATFRGKTRSVWGKFTAAYRVLQRQGLLETANDAEWTGAFKTAYNATLGPDVRGHKLTAQGNGKPDTTDEFKKGVEEVTFWVKGWLDWRGTTVERPIKPFNTL